MKRLVFVHIRDEGNIGDMNCCPRDYFEAFRHYKAFDFRAVPPEYLTPDTLMVIGGGGMMHPGVDGWIEQRIKEQPVVTWGIGHNYHYDAEGKVPSLEASELRLRGSMASMREPGVMHVRHVPCVSCMHPLFDGSRHHPVERPVLYYSHYNYPIPMPHGGYQICNQRRPDWDMAHVVCEMARSAVVVTNSFHGMYWAQLLGKSVVVYKPQATRLSAPLPGGSHPVYQADIPLDAERLAWACYALPYCERSAHKMELLEVCRRQNAMFFADVLRRIDDFSGGPLDKLDP